MKLPPWLDFQRHRDETPFDSARYVVLDTELTSLDRRSNRLLSIGAIAMEGPKIRLQEQFYRVVNPGVAIPSVSVLIHGLRPTDVEAGDPPSQALEELRSFIESAILVGHFVGIDLNILGKELGSTRATLTNPAICTARVEQWILRHRPYSEDTVHRLEYMDLLSLAHAYRLEVQAAHHALQDAYLTAQLWQRQMYALKQMKLKTVGDVLRIARL
jgi:DNA polymerase III subunit epsilon